MSHWYDGKTCSVCAAPLEQTRRRGKPLLSDERGATIEPSGCEPARLEELLASHRPICWSCNLERAFDHEEASAAPFPPPRRAASSWWVGRPCAICRTPLRRGWFWQEKPRLVDGSGHGAEVGAEAPPEDPPALLVCVSCYYNRHGELLAAARNRTTPQP